MSIVAMKKSSRAVGGTPATRACASFAVALKSMNFPRGGFDGRSSQEQGFHGALRPYWPPGNLLGKAFIGGAGRGIGGSRRERGGKANLLASRSEKVFPARPR